jgi:two-component system, NarL family, response regulator DesR
VIRVLLGHRGTLIGGALAAVLAREADLDVVAEVASADEVLSAARRTRPDVAVLDPQLPGALDVGELHRIVPTLGILVLLDRQSDARASLRLASLAPRVGLIATDVSLHDFVDGVRHIAAGQPVLDVDLAVAALSIRSNPLTERERQVLGLLMTGAVMEEIATSLSLSTRTVRNYVSHIMGKTGARTHIEAIRIAEDQGWI